MKANYIWGAGYYGALAALDMEQNGKVIAGFIDNNKELQGKKRLGYEVFSPKQIIKNSGEKDEFIIIAASAANEMADELESNGYKEGEDFGIFGDIGRTRKGGVVININDLELVENVGILFENEVVLYGLELGSSYIKLQNETYLILKNAGISVSYFCDNDSNKWGQCIDDIKIISPSELKQLSNDKDLAIIVATNDAVIMEQIILNISVLKLKTNKIYTKLSLVISLLQNVNDSRISAEHRNACHFTDKLKYFLNIHDEFFQLTLAVKICNILVYQPGKVGSSTIYNSIKKIGMNCVQLHFLNAWNNGNEYKNIFKKSDTIKIITLVREPVNRIISLFFELLGFPPFHRYYYIKSGYSFMNTIIEYFKENISHPLMSQNQFDWFDKELKAVFGIDIYSHPFDKEKGYSIIKQGNVEVLAMKMEKLNSLESVIGEFLCVPQFKLINENEGDKKVYKYLYRNVKDTIKIPREIFDKYYENNPKMDHFYSEEEKAAFLKKWEKNIAE